MYNIINNEKDIGKILGALPKDSLLDIIQSGPILGILIADCFFKRGGKSPVPSVINSKLIGLNFYHWKDISDYINWIFDQGIELKNIKDLSDYKKEVINLSKNKELLLCYSVALFVESQMKVFSRSPFPAQEVTSELIVKQLKDENIFDDLFVSSQNGAQNASIYISLHAGKQLFAAVNFPEPTLRNWADELEAGIVLSIPQIVNTAIKRLEIPESLLLEEIIENELLLWKKDKPKVGESREWSWLPYLENQASELERQNHKEENEIKISDSTFSMNNESILEPNEEDNFNATQDIFQNVSEEKPSYKKYIVYGLLMVLPIPFINWLWIILGIVSAKKDWKVNGKKGIGIQLAIAYGGRLLLGMIISALGG